MNELFLKYSDDKINTIIGIQAHISKFNGNFTLHRHNYCEFEYVVSGTGTQWINGMEYQVSQGDFWGLSIYDYHRCTCNNIVIDNFKIFLPDAPDQISNLIPMSAFPFIGKIDVSHIDEVCENFDLLLDTLTEITKYQEIRTVSLVSLLLTRYLENSEKLFLTDTEKSAFIYVSKTIEYIRRNYNEQIRLIDAAKNINISPCYLSEIFNKYAGCGFAEYTNRIRTQKAQLMLVGTANKITDIAFASGFGSVSNMNRTFIRLNGISPFEYRKKHQYSYL